MIYERIFGKIGLRLRIEEVVRASKNRKVPSIAGSEGLRKTRYKEIRGAGTVDDHLIYFFGRAQFRYFFNLFGLFFSFSDGLLQFPELVLDFPEERRRVLHPFGHGG